MPRLSPYLRIENFLSEEFSQQLLDYAIAHKDEFTHSMIGKGKEGKVNTKVRISHVLRNFGELEQRLQDKINALYPEMLGKLHMSSFKKKEALEIEIAAHGDGAFFAPHIDMTLGQTGHRVLSAVYYMHREPRMFSGGSLRIYPMDILPGDDTPVDIEPTHNSLVVFQSYVYHEVLPISCPSQNFEDYRFAINCWIHKE